MEAGSGVFVDPEEDEIFFCDITEKEAQRKGILGGRSSQLGAETILHNCSEESDHRSEAPERKPNSVNNVYKLNVDANLEKLDLKWSREEMNNEDLTSDPDATVKGTCVEKSAALGPGNGISTGSIICPENEEKKVNSEPLNIQMTSIKKKTGQNHDFAQGESKVHIDHNYSTPIKSVIDKSILKTPKSIVKADKDGGFLKVLSEIALVKAEADENTLKESLILADVLPVNELINDDNKENKQCDNESSNAIIKASEIASSRVNHGLTIRKSNCENMKKTFLSSSVEKLNEDNLDVTILLSDEDVKCSEVTAKEQNIANDEPLLLPVENISDSPNPSDQTEIPEKEGNSDTSNDLEVVFEKINSSSGDILKPCEMYNNEKNIDSDTEHRQLDNLLSTIPAGGVKHEVDLKQEIQTSVGNKKSETGQNENCMAVKNSTLSDDRVKKKCLKRRTMRLLEELNEIIGKEQVKRDSLSGKISIRLSEEAAKVIEGLKAAGIDDSINSPDEYFDLDNLSNSFCTTKLSDILNDTLSKPLCDFTDKDVELLLEKITLNALETDYQSETESAEKENLCQVQADENVAHKKPHNTPDTKKSDMGKFGSSSSVVKSKALESATSVQLKTDEKVTGNSQSLSEKKIIRRNSPGQLQIHQNRLKGVQSVERNGMTRIPKLTSTTSKLPVTGARIGKVAYGKATPSKLNNELTPLSKAQKSLKFNNIKSPVQAYINSKTPVLISNVKGKTESAFNTWRKQGENNAKSVKTETKSKFEKSEPKSNLPFVKYKSAIPLKLEKSPESRLPRLTPKMQKLIGSNSPVITKHEGRIRVGPPKPPQTTPNESTIVASTNEVSVLVSKVAQKTVCSK